MASNKNRKRTTPAKSVLEETMDKFRDSWSYQQANWHKLWERDQKLYDNERVNAQYHGVTDTFVPMSFQTVETMVSALNNSSLRFDYESSDPLRRTSAAPLNSLIDEWWDDDQWDLALEEGSREMLTTGMAGNMFSWELNHPHLDHYAMRDMIVDPTVRNPADLQKPGFYAGRRYFVRKGALANFEVVDTDPDSKTYGQMVKRYKISPTSDTDNSATPHSDDDKSIKEMFDSSTLTDAANKQDEVIEIWDIDRVVTILNRKEVIEDVENPHKCRHRYILKQQYKKTAETPEELAKAAKRASDEAMGLNPFFFLRNYRKASLFYATSEIDSIAKLQESLNDQTNADLDIGIRQNSPQRELDPSKKDWIDMITNEPDVVYPFKPGTLANIDPPVGNPNGPGNRQTTKAEIRETTAIDQIAKGVTSPGDKTATEINTQIQQTGQRIESKARILEKDGLFWMAQIVFRLFQLYVDQPLVVNVKGGDTRNLKTTWQGQKMPDGAAVLDPADYQGQWRPKVTLEIDSTAKREQSQRANTEAFQIMIQDPTNNLEEVKQRMYPKMFDLSKEDIDAITTPNGSALGAEQATDGTPIQAAAPVAEPVAEPAPNAEPLPDDIDWELLAQFLQEQEAQNV